MEKHIVNNYINTGDLTSFCKSMKSTGIVRRKDMMDIILKHSGKEYFENKKTTLYGLVFGHLKSDLDKKLPYVEDEYTNLMMRLNRMREDGDFRILMINGKHIVWAYPAQCLGGYNHKVRRMSEFAKLISKITPLEIWRDVTESNIRKMNIINNYLLR